MWVLCWVLQAAVLGAPPAPTPGALIHGNPPLSPGVPPPQCPQAFGSHPAPPDPKPCERTASAPTLPRVGRAPLGARGGAGEGSTKPHLPLGLILANGRDGAVPDGQLPAHPPGVFKAPVGAGQHRGLGCAGWRGWGGCCCWGLPCCWVRAPLPWLHPWVRGGGLGEWGPPPRGPPFSALPGQGALPQAVPPLLACFFAGFEAALRTERWAISSLKGFFFLLLFSLFFSFPGAESKALLETPTFGDIYHVTGTTRGPGASQGTRAPQTRGRARPCCGVLRVGAGW